MIIQIEPWIDSEELEQLKRVVDSTFVVEHKLTKEFEELTKQMTGAKYAVAVTNGTMALFCCLKAMGIGPGDEVIVPNMTFVATVNAVLLAGAKPVLCEVDKETFCIDHAKVKALITPKTVAIMPVHLYGQTADMDELMKLARNKNLKIIEDAAQGVGVLFNGQHAGTFGEAGILSYYGNKTITCGEGGIVLTNDSNIANKIYKLKNHGRSQKGTFIHEEIGYNFSFTEMQAAVGIAQMGKLQRIVERKATINKKYLEELSGISDLLSPVFIDPRVKPVFWFTSFMSPIADELAENLREHEIQTRRFFYPIHMQPCYMGKSILGNIEGDFTISEEIYKQGISLPSAYNMSEESQLKVIDCVKKFYENWC